MGKQLARLKALIYSLSPFQQKTMSGLWNDMPGMIQSQDLRELDWRFLSSSVLSSALIEFVRRGGFLFYWGGFGGHDRDLSKVPPLEDGSTIGILIGKNSLSIHWESCSFGYPDYRNHLDYVQRYQEKEKLEHMY